MLSARAEFELDTQFLLQADLAQRYSQLLLTGRDPSSAAIFDDEPIIRGRGHGGKVGTKADIARIYRHSNPETLEYAPSGIDHIWGVSQEGEVGCIAPRPHPRGDRVDQTERPTTDQRIQVRRIRGFGTDRPVSMSKITAGMCQRSLRVISPATRASTSRGYWLHGPFMTISTGLSPGRGLAKLIRVRSIWTTIRSPTPFL